MPLRTIATENRVGAGAGKFPRLEFKNKGERHRVLLFQKNDDGQPVVWQEYVHFLRIPLFGDDGMPKMTYKDSKRNDGEKYEDYDTDRLGNPLCLGNAEVIEAEGYDPGGCPICAAVPGAPAEAKLHPQIRFAANVVEYALAPGTWNVQKPLSAKVVIWAFASGTYDDIISQQEQHGELLQKQDLTLEVVNPTFRNVKIGVMTTSGWQESANGAAYLGELLGDPANLATYDQLKAACGRDAKRLFMEEDLAQTLRKWRRALAANGAEDPAGNAPLGGGQQTLAAGVSDLLGGNPAAASLGTVAAQLRDEARREVTAALNPDPFAALGGGTAPAAEAPASSADPFGGTAPAAAAPAAPPSDPFAALGGTAPAAPSTAPEAAAPVAGSPDPFASPAAPTSAAPPASSAPAASPQAAPPSDGKPKSFDDLINDLGGIG